MATVEPIRNKKDIEKVERLLAKQSKRDLMLFVMGTNCGLRISDLLSLNVGDVRNKTHIQLFEKKTGKFKKFPINAKLKPMLAEFVKGRKDKEPLLCHIGNIGSIGLLHIILSVMLVKKQDCKSGLVHIA